MPEEAELWVTKLVNLVLAKPATVLLLALGFHPNPAEPIPNHIAMELFVFLLLAIFFFWLRARLSVERPGAVQQFMEILITNPYRLGVRDMIDDFIGHGGERYLAMLGSIGLFILFMNLISLVPTLSSPTAQYSVPLGCAVLVFLYYNWCGLRSKGPLRYGKHFAGPIPALAPLMVPVEMFSHVARLISLTARLWANMLASEVIYSLILGLTVGLSIFLEKLSPVGYVATLAPFFLPVIFMALHIFVAFVQAFVFTILPIIYVSGAVVEQH
jgi:F-type H+-transporting ATPase subunit a